MTQKEINEKAKKVYEEWHKKRKKIEYEAKKEGIWNFVGFDSNNYLFKEIDDEAKRKIDLLNSQSIEKHT